MSQSETPTMTGGFAEVELRIRLTRVNERLTVELNGKKRFYAGEVVLGSVTRRSDANRNAAALQRYVQAVVADALLDPASLTLERDLDLFETE